MQQQINRRIAYRTKPRQVSVDVGAKIDSGQPKQKTSIQLQKIRSTKDTLNQLVTSNIITELQKQRESPFLRRESNKSIGSKGSFQSSPCRYISPLQKNPEFKGEKTSFNGSIGGLSAQRQRNSFNDLPVVTNTYNSRDSLATPNPPPRQRALTLIKGGTQVIACMRGAQGASQLNYKTIEPSLAEIKEKRESSAKKVAKK